MRYGRNVYRNRHSEMEKEQVWDRTLAQAGKSVKEKEPQERNRQVLQERPAQRGGELCKGSGNCLSVNCRTKDSGDSRRKHISQNKTKKKKRKNQSKQV